MEAEAYVIVSTLCIVSAYASAEGTTYYMNSLQYFDIDSLVVNSTVVVSQTFIFVVEGSILCPGKPFPAL